jgi:hypothetical protein
MKRIQQIVTGHHRGMYTLLETLAAVVCEIDDVNANEVLRQLSPELLSALKSKVEQAPSTEEDWNEAICIDTTMGRETAAEREARRSEGKRKYRTGIESLRRLFAATDYGPRTAD